MTTKDTIVLGIETSCDETAAAVVKNGHDILSNAVASQVQSHQRFGGVVPEVASRHHVEQITMMIATAMKDAGVDYADLDAIAVTQGPGLVGALLIGVNAAKALAFARQIPLVAVHHIAGHIYANYLQEGMRFPLLSLVVSGGHTELIYMPEHGRYQVIGETRDDAAGEAYDKIARTLTLPYPGGPQIDHLAQQGNVTIDFPRAWLEQGSYDFSFSGLKSSVLNRLHNAKQRGEKLRREDVAASFQESVIDVLVGKTLRAVDDYGIEQVVVAGGVAANSGLRHRLEKAFTPLATTLSIPPLYLCTDNAAMIAAAGTIEFVKGWRSDLRLNAHPGLDIERFNVTETVNHR